MLRGINVSGHNKINMSELKLLYEELKFDNITTYIQSGNVIFSTDQTNFKILSQKIEQKIFEQYGFNIPVIIRSVSEMQAVISNNPFYNIKNFDSKKLYITFLSDIPSASNLETIKEYHYEPDSFVMKEKEVYVFCPNGYGKNKLTNIFFENKLKVTATTRNWRTVNEIIHISTHQ